MSELNPTDDLKSKVKAEHHSIPSDVREQILSRDGYCQVSGCRNPTTTFDTPGLLVQRIDDNPDHCHPNDAENLVTRCLDCSVWIRQMPTRDDLPPGLRERLDGADLDADHIKILQYVHNNGPARTGELHDIVDRANPTSVRRALYDLMGRDVCDDAVGGRLLAKDRLAGVYGLPWQIPDDRQARGTIPLKPHERRTRILDAVTDRLIETLEGRVDNPREIAAAVVDRQPNQTYNMQTRARAFQFPCEEWAATDRTRHDEAAAVEAVTILAAASENVSRRHIAEPLVEILERNDDHELATVVRDVLLEDGESFELFTGPAEEPVADAGEGSTADAGGEAVDPPAMDATLRTFDGDVTTTRSPATGTQRSEATHDDRDHQ